LGGNGFCRSSHPVHYPFDLEVAAPETKEQKAKLDYGAIQKTPLPMNGRV
jgi:hypothetical protein